MSHGQHGAVSRLMIVVYTLYVDASWNGGIPDNPQIIHFNGMFPWKKQPFIFRVALSENSYPQFQGISDTRWMGSDGMT